jgi:hypothetical protein
MPRSIGLWTEKLTLIRQFIISVWPLRLSQLVQDGMARRLRPVSWDRDPQKTPP